MRLAARRFTMCSALLASLSVCGAARAYSYYTFATEGCHERISAEALRRVREELPAAGPLSGTERDEVIIDELPFPVADDMRDIGAATLLLGVRDNDLKGRDGFESTDLATVHGDPDGQREHCLRRPEHDEPPLVGPGAAGQSGSEPAVTECRDYIRSMMRHAIEAGLGADGAPDPEARTVLEAHFEFSGSERVSVPIFPLYAGQALHALQDSFTHTFRTRDGRRITVVLNWVDFAAEVLDERRDGPPHMVALDRCDDPDALRTERRRLATEASISMLRAALAPAPPGIDPTTARFAAVDAVIDEYVTFEPGCTFDNRWCDAPENAYRDAGCGCRSAPSPHGAAWAIAAAVVACALARRWTQRMAAC